MDDQDVTPLDGDARLLFPALEVRRPVDLVVADAHFLQVDDTRRADEEVDGQLADAFGAGDEVVRRIEMRADVQG